MLAWPKEVAVAGGAEMGVVAARVVGQGVAVVDVASVPWGMALPKPAATLGLAIDCVGSPAVVPAVEKGNKVAWLDPMLVCPVAQ